MLKVQKFLQGSKLRRGTKQYRIVTGQANGVYPASFHSNSNEVGEQSTHLIVRTALACAPVKESCFLEETILDAMQNQTVQHQSQTPLHTDAQTPAPKADSVKPRLQNIETNYQTLLHDHQKMASPLEKPHVTVAPRFAAPPQGEKSSQAQPISGLQTGNTTSNVAVQNQLHPKNVAEPTRSGTPDANSSSYGNEEIAKTRSVGSKAGKPAERKKEQGKEIEEHPSIDAELSKAIHARDIDLAKKLLKQGAKLADDASIHESEEGKTFLYLLANSEDIEMLHNLVAYASPESKAGTMEIIADHATRSKLLKMMEYVARHSDITDWMIYDATLDRSNKTYQALIDGGLILKEGFGLSVMITSDYPTSKERLASLPKKKNIAAQAFDAHRDQKYEEADKLFMAPAPDAKNPLGLTDGMLRSFSENGLSTVLTCVDSQHAGLISTMPDPLLAGGFRSKIVWILRSSHKECKAAREALTRQMGASGLTLFVSKRAGNITPCNDKELEQFLFAFQLQTHEALLQIVQPPVEEKKDLFQTMKADIFSFFNLDKNTKAATAQAKTLIQMAQAAPQIMLQSQREILQIKADVLEKRITAQAALEFAQEHQALLEEQFEELMSGKVPGTPVSDQVIVKIYGDAFRELAAIREAAQDNSSL
jgi:hypothetical protein